MKRYLIWIIILSLSLVFIGNEKSTEIASRALVHAVGIDMDENGYTVTLQIFQSEGAGSDTQIDPSKSNTQVISNTAPTFEEAMMLCENQLGNYIFIGHNQIIVLGSTTDFQHPEELLSYFINKNDNFLGVNVVLAEKTAKEILDVKIPTETITTSYFKEVVKIHENKGETCPSDMVAFLNECMKPDKSTILPIVSLKEESSDQQSSQGQEQQSQGGQKQEDSQSQGSSSSENTLLTINSSAIISHGKVVGKISNAETRCIALLTDKAKYSLIDVNYKNNNLSIKLSNNKSKVKIYAKNNKLIYDVKLRVKGSSNDITFSESDKKGISKAIENQLESQCKMVFNKVFNEYNADVFDFYRLIKHYCPDIYLKYKDNFDALKANTEFNINIDCLLK